MWALKDRTVIFLQGLAVTFTALLLIMGLVRYLNRETADFTDSEYFRSSRELELQTDKDPLNARVALQLGNFYYFLAKSEENWLNNDITNEYEVIYYRDQIAKWKQLGYDVTAYENDLQHGRLDQNLRESFQQQQMQVCRDAYDRALKYYFFARALEPESWSEEDNFRVGVVFLKKGESFAGETEKYLQAAYQGGFRNGEILTCLGNLTYQQRDYAGAAKYYTAALEHNPEDLVMNFNLALALMELKDYPQAKARFTSLLDREAIKEGSYPGMLAHIQLYLGQIALVENQPEQAAARFQQALEQQESLVEGWYYLGLTYVRMNLKSQAREAYGKALALQPDNKKIREAIAQL